jgi:ketosteroid isomerase-like protein
MGYVMVVDVADKVSEMFDAVVSGDVARFRTCFEPNAVVWHNTDEQELGIPVVEEMINAVCAQTTIRAYEARRSIKVGNVLFVQHTLAATLRSGHKMRCPVMMRIEIAKSGLVARIDEYFDSRTTDCLGSVPGLSGTAGDSE